MIGIFTDVSDIYYQVNRKFNAKLNYQAYIDTISNRGQIFRAFAYCSQKAPSFLTYLRGCGFEPKYKRPKIIRINNREIKQCNWGVSITVDIIHYLNDLDTVVLGTSNPDFIPLIQWIKDCDIKVIILACCIPISLRNVANEVIEITEEELEDE